MGRLERLHQADNNVSAQFPSMYGQPAEPKGQYRASGHLPALGARASELQSTQTYSVGDNGGHLDFHSVHHQAVHNNRSQPLQASHHQQPATLPRETYHGGQQGIDGSQTQLNECARPNGSRQIFDGWQPGTEFEDGQHVQRQDIRHQNGNSFSHFEHVSPLHHWKNAL